VEYKLEYYHSESEKKTYEAKLPDDIRGEFGTELKAFIVRIYNIHARIIKHSCTCIKVGREGNDHFVWDPFP
jgi:hypothetical protein